MWELICHQTYQWEGLPVDLSPYDNDAHAEGTGYLPDGAAAGSGALEFGSHPSRVRIPPGPAWTPLGALQVEAVIRLDGQGFYRTVAWGDESFEVRIWANGELEALVSPPGGGRQVPLLDSTAAFAPDGDDHAVPADQWVTVGFVHDGLCAARLMIDGAVVGAVDGLAAGVPRVRALGVQVGNAGIGSAPLRGAVDEVRFWRRDPRRMWNDFGRRPVDAATAACWHDFLLRLGEILARYPECARQLLPGFRAALERFARAAAAHGPGARERYAEACREYQEIWRTDDIDGTEMAALLTEWVAWLRSLGLDPATDRELGALFDSECLRRLIETAARLDCDPRFAALLGRLVEPGSGKGAAAE